MSAVSTKVTLPASFQHEDHEIWDISQIFNRPTMSVYLWRGTFGGLKVTKESNDFFFDLQDGIRSGGLVLPGYRGITGELAADREKDRVGSVNKISCDRTFDPAVWLERIYDYFENC